MKKNVDALGRYGIKPFLVAFFSASLLWPSIGSAASLTIASAASMTTALREIGDLYEKKTGITLVFSFGSSGTLSRQIENGAPFDLFISADTSHVDALVKKGMLDKATVRVYAVGRIGIATKKGSGTIVRSMSDLASPSIRKIAIANPAFAPYGVAAKEALESAGLWDAVKAKLVYGENIRQTLQFVETGNVDAGIIALSLQNRARTDFILIDASQHAPLRQSMGVVVRSSNKEAASGFAAFLSGKEGREILGRSGFEIP